MPRQPRMDWDRVAVHWATLPEHRAGAMKRVQDQAAFNSAVLERDEAELEGRPPRKLSEAPFE
jgi:hypothetical protein